MPCIIALFFCVIPNIDIWGQCSTVDLSDSVTGFIGYLRAPTLQFDLRAAVSFMTSLLIRSGVIHGQSLQTLAIHI